MSNNETSNVQRGLHDSLTVPIIKDKAEYVHPSSLHEAVRKNKDTLLDIKKRGGFSNLVGWTIGRLIKLFSYLGVYDTATDFQIQMLANRICAKYFYITPAELDYFFVSFENGEYRKLINNGRSINPQDIMMSLVEYEKDLLEERGRAEEERKKEELAKQEAEAAKKPHGLEAWKIYCEKNNLDPATHSIQSVNMKEHDVNRVLYESEKEREIALRKFNRENRKDKQSI